MTAQALAGELKLPLMTVQLHGLITKYMGETAAKLHLIFSAMNETRGVYLFDEFDAIGSDRGKGNDASEIRRVLNSFLHFLELDDSDSLIVAATNDSKMLDDALFRRFDDVVEYAHPDEAQTQLLIENRLNSFGLGRVSWKKILETVNGLSHAEIVRACQDAAKDYILDGKKTVTTAALTATLQERHREAKAPGQLGAIPMTRLSHLILTGTASTDHYISTAGRSGKFRTPPRDSREGHGQLLIGQATAAQQETAKLREAGEVVQSESGILLELRSDPGFRLRLESLERRQSGIELINVRIIDEVMHATVFVPEDTPMLLLPHTTWSFRKTWSGSEYQSTSRVCPLMISKRICMERALGARAPVKRYTKMLVIA